MNEPDMRIVSTGTTSNELSFETDGVMPEQFYPGRRRAPSLEPVMRLMAAVLIDAVRCFQRTSEASHTTGRREFREVQRWIFDDRGHGPFSFQSVCESLEIDPGGLRSWLVRGRYNRRSGGDKPRTIRRSPVNVTGRLPAHF